MPATAELAPIFRRPYMLAGNAIVTVVSKQTGTRYTYRIRAKRTPEGEPNVHWVSVLTGDDNVNSYNFLGTIFEGQRYFHGRKSRIDSNAPSAKAFNWLWRNLCSEDAEVWHSGKCARCGRMLTVPESIQSGIGPTCAGKI